MGKTADSGEVTFDIDTQHTGFDGYFEITTAGGITSLLVLGYKITGDMTVPRGDGGLAPADGGAARPRTTRIVMDGPPAAAPPIDPPRSGTGLVTLQVLDCLGSNVMNGSISASQGTVLTRNAAGNYVPSSTGPGVMWAYVNDVPEGLVTIRASKDETIFAEETVPVRAGMATSVHMLPLTAR
jgi:hypothetical protein